MLLRTKLQQGRTLIKYHIGEERSEAGVYENADLMFIANKVLYVIDFKLAGILNKLSQIFSLKEGQIPYQIHGLPVNISVGELSFAEFLKNIMKIKNKLLELKEVSPELKGFLQVLSYGVDYLCERGQDNLKEISLSLLYPVPESFSARFYLDGKDITPYRDEVRELYEQLKSREPEYAQAENPSRGTKSRLLRETRNRIDELLKLMQEKEKEDEVIKPDSINLSRQDVGKRLDEFFKREEPVKVLCLLHSAGSGKTSQTRERILKLDGNHIVLYMATRRVLLDREYEVLMRKQKEGYDIALVYEKRSSKGKERVENIGDTYQSSLAEMGILKRTVDKINEYRGKKRFIWAFITQQAIVETQNGKSTTKHLMWFNSKSVLRKYTFHIILDEFLGHQNGLFAIEELLEFLQTIKENEGRANLYLFDANGYTPHLLEKLLEEYNTFEVIPSAVILSDFEREVVFQHKGTNIYAYAFHGYPSPEIRIRRKFIDLSGKFNDDEIIEKVVAYIKETFQDKDSSTAFMFVQYKQHIALLKDRLKQEGFSVLVATADSKKSQESINKGEEDIILATSSISRGIDLSRPHKPVNHIYAVIYDWGIENNLVELIQSVSRARGDEKTENQPKNIHLIYVINPTDDYVVDRIAEYYDDTGENVDEELIRLLHRKKSLEQKIELDYLVSGIIKQFVKSSEGKVLVPIPNQYKTRYIPNHLSNLESVIGFLEGISQIENNDKLEDT